MEEFVIVKRLFIAIFVILMALYFLFRKLRSNLKELSEKLDQIAYTTQEVLATSSSSSAPDSPTAVASEESASEESPADKDSKPSEEEKQAHALAIARDVAEMMEKRGCQPRINDDHSVAFAYQGEHFVIEPNGAFIRIWDFSWLRIKTNDEYFHVLRDAINYINFQCGPTLILHAPDEEGEVVLSSRLDALYTPDLPKRDEYLSMLLSSFFAVKQGLDAEIKRLKDDPEDLTMHSNPSSLNTEALRNGTSPQAN